MTVTDVVPLADTDPRGTGLTAAMFPLVIGGMLGGIAISLRVIGAMRRVAAVLAYSVATGLLLTGILQGWFGALQGDYWLNSAAIALAVAAIAAPITGFVALMGRAGIGVGVLHVPARGESHLRARSRWSSWPSHGARSASGSRRVLRPRCCATCRTSRPPTPPSRGSCSPRGRRRHPALPHRALPHRRRAGSALEARMRMTRRPLPTAASTTADRAATPVA